MRVKFQFYRWLIYFLLIVVQIARADQNLSNADLTASFHEQVLYIPVDEIHSVKLQVTLITPNGSGPFPLAVINHGSNGDANARKHQPRNRDNFATFYFLSRGYAVVLPMMRGFAGSDGNINFHGCEYQLSGIENAKDIQTVINQVVAHFSFIDSNRIVMSGQSFGGWNTLAYGTLNDSRVKGLIIFSGTTHTSDCVAPDFGVASAARNFGAHTQAPSLWFYGENDTLVDSTEWRAMHISYNQGGGGKAELVDYGRFMDNSHMLLAYPEGLKLWMPKTDAFLARIGLPHTQVYPEYLPMQIPPVTHYAAIDDVNAVPYLLTDQNKLLYREFLKLKFPRAFVISPGHASVASGGFDPLARALQGCRRVSLNTCRPYAVDNDVVWAWK